MGKGLHSLGSAHKSGFYASDTPASQIYGY
jgi:hypothetical protein